ncbi:uncharacterized protein CIMG_03661 [Coccidioides immitis RS]|uniref:Coiled-coil domain-containing protein 174 n=1 Tax=Coccidioides immitis (strain RS) TaxID=246410 RepID=J3KBV8_COCIM|nr:uncharacterized protein CIMG_03661 [Coccidioides immitis RS]EAS32637.3 hypothetical protein CIMG_03661 [Coccidioides immitis RS]TPX19672.1 hypothetical protein DIZ76_017464 [Coccidioides immitis]
MPTDSSLYGIRRPKAEASKKDVTSPGTLAFATHLSSLIAKESANASSQSRRGRARPSRKKDDIFSVHNKGALKRAAADISLDNPNVSQVHKQSGDIGFVDEATLHRSKRRMAEKAKLYAELKKGEYLAASSDEEDDDSLGGPLSAVRRAEKNSLVDFDRKWAEEEVRKSRYDSGESDHESEKEPLVEYEDEFGRTRQGTRAEAAEAERLRRSRAAERSEQESITSSRNPNLPMGSRPSRPANLIHGSIIQSAAFDPDANVAAQMSRLAERRDRTPTPPPETHYDAEGEVRNRGTGFYAFSKDEEARKQEMEELMQARDDTVKGRSQAATRKEARQKAKADRLKKIEELRGKRRAEEFMKGLGSLEGLGSPSALESKAEER